MVKYLWLGSTNVTKRILTLQKGTTNVTKRILMLQKGSTNVTKRILCYKKEEQVLPKGLDVTKRTRCYKKECLMLQKGSPMLQEGLYVTKRIYVVLSVTKYVTKRTLKCYKKEH